MNELIEKVLTWSYDRNIIDGSDFYRQYMKAQSEMGELAAAYLKEDREEIKDAIGDVLVCLINLSEQCDVNLKFTHNAYVSYLDVHGLYGRAQMNFGRLADTLLKGDKDGTELHLERVISRLDSIAAKYKFGLEDCLEAAYNEIKDRKGVMFQGVFIKESDENYERIVQHLAKDSVII